MKVRASTPSSSGWTAAAALAALWIASLAGLLWIPLDLYDEPALAMGGRIVRGGGLPYLDFYTHYGPLGYSLMALFLGLGHAGIAYRLAQAAALALIAFPMVRLAGRLASRRAAAAALAAFGLLNFSAAIVAGHFFAYALLVFGLELVALGELEADASASRTLWIAAGASMSLAGLVRPAFAAYGIAAVVGYALAVREPRRFPRLARFLAAAAGVAPLAWLLLYRRIPLTDAWLAAVVVPARLTGGAARFLAPALLPSGKYAAGMQTAFASIHLAALVVLATLAAVTARETKARIWALAGAAVALATPFVLRGAASPGSVAAVAVILVFGCAVASFASAAPTMRQEASARVSALAGLSAIAFLHYYLTRADPAHLTAALALAIAAAVCGAPSITPQWRAAAAGLTALAALPLLVGAVRYPAYWIGRASGGPALSTASGFWERFPASRFPAEAVRAVARADDAASPSSRFVALATDHSRTEGSAVVLFLLSRRLPYTRWYVYDPGIQSAPGVQALMIRELEASGSATAVTWRSESFAGVHESDSPATPLDVRFRELYPRVADHFGGLEVRETR